MKKILLLLIMISVPISGLFSIEFTLVPHNVCSDSPITLAFVLDAIDSPDELNYVGIRFNYSSPVTSVSHSCAGLPTESWFQTSSDDGSSYIFAASDLTSSALISSPCTLAYFNLGNHVPGARITATVTLLNYEIEGTGSTVEFDLTGFAHPDFFVEDCGEHPCTLDTEVSAEQYSVCAGNPVRLNANAGAYSPIATYSWTPAESLDDPYSPSPIATPYTTTTYTVLTYVSEDCYDEKDVTINVISAFDLGLDDTIVCRDAFVQIGVENIYESYLWSTGDINFRISFIADFVEDSLFWLEVTDSYGCTVRDSFIVRTNPCPDCDLVLSIEREYDICRGESQPLFIDVGELQDRAFFWWSPDTDISDTRSDSPTVSPDTTSTYTVYVMYSPECYDTASVTVRVHPLAKLDLSSYDTLVCRSDLIRIDAPAGYESYRWNNDPVETNRSIYILAEFDYRYISLEVWDSLGCRDIDSFLIETEDCPDHCNLIADMVADTFICRGQFIDLWAVSAYDTLLYYRWHPEHLVEDPYSSVTFASPESTTIFRLIATLPGECADTKYVRVRVGPEIPIDFGEMIQCRNDTVPLWAPEGYEHYIWSTGEVTRGIRIYTDFTSREFWVRAIDRHGCMESDTFVITTTICDEFDCRLSVGIRTKLDSVYLCRGDTLELNALVRNAEGEAVYSWEPKENIIHSHLPNARVFPTQTTTYIVTVQDDSLCTAVDTIVVNVYRCRPIEPIECLAHPRPFTPNNDGINDELFFRYPEMNEADGIVYIYNLDNVLVRQIDRSQGYRNAEGSIIWDGKDNNGRNLPTGPYLYVLVVGDETVCKGTAYLAR